MLFPYTAALQVRRRSMGLGRYGRMGSFGDDSGGLDFLSNQDSADPVLANLSTDGTPIAQSTVVASPSSSSTSSSSGSSSVWDAAGQLIGSAAKIILPGAPAAAKPAVAAPTILGVPQQTFLIGAGLLAVGAYFFMKKSHA